MEKLYPIEQETYDRMYDIVERARIQSKMEDDDPEYERLVRWYNKGVDQMYKTVQNLLWRFCVDYNREVAEDE